MTCPLCRGTTLLTRYPTLGGGLALAAGVGFEQSGDVGRGLDITDAGGKGRGNVPRPGAPDEPVALSGHLDLRSEAEFASALRVRHPAGDVTAARVVSLIK
jgi:hypothetical protein